MGLPAVGTSTLVLASRFGYRWAAEKLLQAVTRNKTNLVLEDPATWGMSLDCRLEQQRKVSIPMSNVLRLIDPNTQAELYLMGAPPTALSSPARALVEHVRPGVVLVEDRDVTTLADDGVHAQPSPFSNMSLHLLSKDQLRRHIARVQTRTHATTGALQAARDRGVPVGLFGWQAPGPLSPSDIQTLLYRAARLPPHLFRYDPVISTLLNGARCAALTQRLRESCAKARRVVAVVSLDLLPILHTMWNAHANTMPDTGTAGADNALVAVDPHPEAAPTVSQRALVHFLATADGQEGPLGPAAEGVRRRLLPFGRAVLEWDEKPATALFWRDVEAIRALTTQDSENYDEKLVHAAWLNVATVFVNSLLLARPAEPLPYPSPRHEGATA